MLESGTWSTLDAFLAPPLRMDLEERFWRPIEAESTLEALRADPGFLRNPASHPAMFSDHGVVHVRDVATGVVTLVDAIDGVLLHGRPADRRRFVQAVGVATAYLHDIGMIDMTPVGRRIHPAFAAHAAFGPGVDRLLEGLLADGPIGERLEAVASRASFGTSLDLVLREILSTTVAHSKSAVPAAFLNDRPAFRRLLQRVVFTDLREQRAPEWHPAADGASPAWSGPSVSRYEDPAGSFGWLVATEEPHAALADDVIDALRALRAADVLRQRGSVLRTSGGFELYMDARTARAMCTLRPTSGDAAYVVTYDDQRAAGEANVRVAFVTPQGHLRIAFHRGAFADAEAVRRAVVSVGDVVIDIADDVIPSFDGAAPIDGLRPPRRAIEDVLIQLERPDDHPAFADDVAAYVADHGMALANRLVVVSNVEGAAAAERRRYHGGQPLGPGSPEAEEVIRRMVEHGFELGGLDRHPAFSEVCRATVRAGEVLVAEGSPSSFVYIPADHGLVVRPGGGYAPSPLHPWLPVGTTGVVRRAERNSEVVAERDVEVVMIPGELFARDWLRPLGVDDFAARLRSTPPD
jgi:hypothetical protein